MIEFQYPEGFAELQQAWTVGKEDFWRDQKRLEGSTDGNMLLKAHDVSWRMGLTDFDPALVLSIYSIIKDQDLSGIEYAPNWHYYHHFNDCRSVEEVKAKLDVAKRLTHGRPWMLESDAYPFQIFDFGSRYPVFLREGSFEANGGFGIELYDTEYPYAGKELMSVEGGLHTHTNVLKIQGRRNKAALIQNFKDNFGIHPANLMLLMYLRIGQVLGHERVEIAGVSDKEYNSSHFESNLYDIPRNYFRLRVNPESGTYQFDGITRDRILDKFIAKHPIVAEAFAKLDDYLQAA